MTAPFQPSCLHFKEKIIEEQDFLFSRHFYFCLHPDRTWSLLYLAARKSEKHRLGLLAFKYPANISGSKKGRRDGGA